MRRSDFNEPENGVSGEDRNLELNRVAVTYRDGYSPTITFGAAAILEVYHDSRLQKAPAC